MQLGKTQTLKIAEKNTSGLFLESQTGERAFLPKIFAIINNTTTLITATKHKYKISFIPHIKLSPF